ncbi:MAG: discoidin domain-containing protein [Mediterranea sp.]|nr:discoidin domain-containing protein [Mediterranea sp.]
MSSQPMRFAGMLCLAGILIGQAVNPRTICAQPALRQQFSQPSGEALPFTLWYWMYGASSKDALTADLEAMKSVGLGGAYMVHIKTPDQGPAFPDPAPQLSPQWWDNIAHAIREADRLGLKLGMHICDGFALAGGPWFTPEESMQKVVFADTVVVGGRIRSLKLNRPPVHDGYYEDIALLAYPLSPDIHPEAERLAKPEVTYSKEITFSEGFYRARASSITGPASSGAWIQYTFDKPYTCRNIEIEKVANNYQSQNLSVAVSDDGVNFRLVKRLVPARQGWQDYVINNTHTLPPTTARYFRLYWNPSGSDPGSEDMNDAKWKPNLKLGRVWFHSEPRLNQWEGKSGAVWRVAPETTAEELSDSVCVRKEDIIDLTRYMRGDTLTADLPQGTWKIVRLGHTSTGHTNATGGAGKGLECDKFSREAVKKQADNWFGAVFRNTDEDVARRVLKYFYIDSWECGSQNWSRTFAEEFKRRRAYDLRPYLLLYAGIPVESADVSEKVLRDIRTTIGELVTDVFYDVMAASAKAYGCEFTAECVAPTMISDGMMHYKKVDLPMGEFWLNSPTHDKFNDMLDAVSGGRIYGKNIIQAEGFTQVRGTWDEHPAMFKSLLDQNYALGLNRLVYHVMVHSPFSDRRPGMTLDGIGIFFQRSQTWWPDGARAFTTYAARCQVLLQYGRPVVDIGVFTGEEMPRRAVLPDQLVASLPGLFGAAKVERERERMANVETPVRTIVGVSQSTRITVPEDWINPLRGYAYDSFNRDVLLNGATVRDRSMVLPEGGASYRVVVLPLPYPMNPGLRPLSDEVRIKIEELRAGGVIIPELPFNAEDLSGYGLERDVIVPEGVAWTHRSGEEAEIYFLANGSDRKQTFEASLRAIGRRPQLWNPVTGEITEPQSWTQDLKRTVIPLVLEANESVFIVFPDDDTQVVEPVRSGRKPTKAIPLEAKPWRVNFLSTGRILTGRQLFDWSHEDDDQIKYYSGKATYSTTFKWDGRKEGRIYLALGQIANVAVINLNGIDCGTVWTAPYRADVTHAIKKGGNVLEITVANTWANALSGFDQSKAPFEGIWTNGKYRRADRSLLPAGLLGPLELQIDK